MKKIFFFILAMLISLLGAMYRFGDSAHSIGQIKTGGGEIKHPAYLEGGSDRYTLITTATVIPPYRGDARVMLEGSPELDYKIYASEPVIDLKLRNGFKFSKNILYNLKPADRIALWVVMRAPAAKAGIKGKYALALYDLKTNQSILTVPVIFKGKGEMDDAAWHKH
jgi:hypothetical protein